jgi:hypothetical protein
MRRFKASAALLLTAFFAVAGSFHRHDLPKPTHDHAGFCSAATAGIALESCALCKVAHTTVHVAARTFAPHTTDTGSLLATAPSCAAPSSRSALLSDPRAPPTV